MRGVNVVALCDIDRAKARALADRFEIPDVYVDLEDLFDAGELDAIIISTPSHLHQPYTLEALAAGVDVLCERPLALTTRGVQVILEEAELTGRKVVVANNHRFRSDVQALDRFLRGGELGTLTGIRAGAYHQHGTVSGLAAQSRGVGRWRAVRPRPLPGRPGACGSPTIRRRSACGRTSIGRAARTPWKTRRSSRWSARTAWRARSTSRGRTSVTKIAGGSSPSRRAAARDSRRCAW